MEYTPNPQNQKEWKSKYTPYQPLMYAHPFLHIRPNLEFVTKPMIIPVCLQKGVISREWTFSDDHFNRLNNRFTKSDTVPSVIILCFEERHILYPQKSPIWMTFPANTSILINNVKKLTIIPPKSKNQYPLDLTPYLYSDSSEIPRKIKLSLNFSANGYRVLCCLVMGERIPAETIIRKMNNEFFIVSPNLARDQYFRACFNEIEVTEESAVKSNLEIMSSAVDVDNEINIDVLNTEASLNNSEDIDETDSSNRDRIEKESECEQLDNPKFDGLNDEEETSLSSTKLVLRDPITKSLIEIPCRGAQCLHPLCFDLKSFLLMNSTNLSLECPICNVKIRMYGGDDCDSGIIVNYFRKPRKRCYAELEHESESSTTIFDLVTEVEFTNLGPDLLICGCKNLKSIINDIKHYTSINKISSYGNPMGDIEEIFIIPKDGSWYVSKYHNLGNAELADIGLQNYNFDMKPSNTEVIDLSDEE